LIQVNVLGLVTSKIITMQRSTVWWHEPLHQATISLQTSTSTWVGSYLSPGVLPHAHDGRHDDPLNKGDPLRATYSAADCTATLLTALGGAFLHAGSADL
jgi:hypothetical protein